MNESLTGMRWRLEHVQVKWTRFTGDNAAQTKTGADPTQVKTALD
jgi:hypothetical protein